MINKLTFTKITERRALGALCGHLEKDLENETLILGLSHKFIKRSDDELSDGHMLSSLGVRMHQLRMYKKKRRKI